MSKKISSLLLGVILTSMASCSSYDLKSSADSGFNAKVQDIVFKRCISCHAGGRAEGNLGFIDQPQLLYKAGYIIPGDPDGSLLYQMVAGTKQGQDRMPYGGPYLNETQLADIAAWIRDFEKQPKFKVNFSGERITLKSAATQEIFEGDAASMSFVVEEGAFLDEASTGDCPQGGFNPEKNIYSTGPITADCTVKLKALKNFTVTPSAGDNITLVPNEKQTIIEGRTASFQVSVESGYEVNRTVGGDCPKGSWKEATYSTGEIKSDCSVTFTRMGQVSVSLSGTHISLTPSGTKIISTGSVLTVKAEAHPGYSLSQTVGGTCPAGVWDGNSYTIPAISESCTLSFSASAQYTVTVSSTPFDLTGVGTYPAGQETLSFTPTKSVLQKVSASAAADPSYSVSNTVGGTCPTGSWSGRTYTTGTITSSCTIVFNVANPCPLPSTATISFETNVKRILTNEPNSANKSCMGSSCHRGTVTTRSAFASIASSTIPSWSVMTERSEAVTPNGLIKANDEGVNNAATGGYLIEPFDPLNSWLYRKVTDSWLGYNKMPKSGSTYLNLNSIDQSAICHWIWQGALNN